MKLGRQAEAGEVEMCVQMRNRKSVFPIVVFPASSTVPDRVSIPKYEEKTDEHFK